MLSHAIWVVAAICWIVSAAIKHDYNNMLGWICVLLYALSNLAVAYLASSIL